MEKTRKDPRIEQTTDGTTVVHLSRTYEDHEGKPLDRLVLPEEASVFHLRAMDSAEGQVGKEVAFVAALTGQKVSTLNKFKAVDFMTVQEAAKPLLGKPRETGPTS